MLAVTEMTVVSAPKLIIAAWLASWFDGSAHAVGSNAPAVFPKCNIVFGQSEANQPLSEDVNGKKDGVSTEIRTVLVRRNETSRMTSDSVSGLTKTITVYASLQFWIRTKKVAKGASDGLADNVAQLLKAIATNPTSRYAMARFGLRHLIPQEPEAVQSSDFTVRLVTASVEIIYALNFTPATSGEIPTNAVAPQQIPFTREESVVPGDYLLGQFSWDTAKVITEISLIALAPQVTPLTLALELNGVLTATTITLPTGVANTSATTAITGLLVAIPANSQMRWRVTGSAADPAASAWMISLVAKVK